MHYRSSKEYQAWLYKIHGTMAVEISMYPHAIENNIWLSQNELFCGVRVIIALQNGSLSI